MIILVASLLLIVATLFVPVIPQWQSYHNFADASSFLLIPNAQNVLSNGLFLIAGIWGCVVVARNPKQFSYPAERIFYYTLFIGSIFVAFGSGYYHWQPNNTTLVWDRLPMTISFMALFTAMIGERINPKIAARLFVPLLLFGMGSVIYWHFTDDLRWYALVQFGSAFIILLMILLYKSYYQRLTFLYITFACYGIAKVLELLDVHIYNLTHHLTSGHTLKHIFSGLAVFSLVKYISDRHPLPR